MSVRVDSDGKDFHLPDQRSDGPRQGRYRHVMPEVAIRKNRHRTLFLSDLHLGARASRPDRILRFLQENEADTLYLVGDIVDNWHPLAGNWGAGHHGVIQEILSIAQSDTRVIYIPGNHDAFFRQYAGTTFGGIEVLREARHQAADGRTYLVTHGDCCDIFARKAPVLARLGSLIETVAHMMDRGQRLALSHFRSDDWTGIERLIARTNGMIRKHDRFEERLAALALREGADGIICGHFHQPALHEDFGVTYANCGDWVGSDTALTEGYDGTLTLFALTDPQTDPAGLPESAEPEGELPLAV